MRERGRRWSALPPDAAEPLQVQRFEPVLGSIARAKIGLTRLCRLCGLSRDIPAPAVLDRTRVPKSRLFSPPFKNPKGCSKGKGSWSPMILRSAQRRADKWAGTPVPHYLTYWSAFASAEKPAVQRHFRHPLPPYSGELPGFRTNFPGGEANSARAACWRCVSRRPRT